MKRVLVGVRCLLESFEDCRNYDFPVNAQRHILVFNKTLLRLGSCKLQIEAAFTSLLERMSAPQIETLMKRDLCWDDLQLQTKLRLYLQDDWFKFRKIVCDLEKRLSYFKEKMAIKGNVLVRTGCAPSVPDSEETATLTLVGT